MPRFRRLSQSIRRTKSQPFVRRLSRQADATKKQKTKINAVATSPSDFEQTIKYNQHQHQKENEHQLNKHQKGDDENNRPKSYFRPYDMNIPTINHIPMREKFDENRRKTIGIPSAISNNNLNPTTTSTSTTTTDRPSSSILTTQSQLYHHSSSSSTITASSTPPTSNTPIDPSKTTAMCASPSTRRRYVRVSVADFTAPIQQKSSSVSRRGSYYENDPDTFVNLDIGERVHETLISPSSSHHQHQYMKPTTNNNEHLHQHQHRKQHSVFHTFNPSVSDNHNVTKCTCHSHCQSLYNSPYVNDVRVNNEINHPPTPRRDQPSLNQSPLSSTRSPVSYYHSNPYANNNPYSNLYTHAHPPVYPASLSPMKHQKKSEKFKGEENFKEINNVLSTTKQLENIVNFNEQKQRRQKQKQRQSKGNHPMRLPSFATLSSSSPGSSLLSTTFSTHGTEMSMVATDALSLSRSNSPDVIHLNSKNEIIVNENQIKKGEYGEKKIDGHFFDSVSSDEEENNDGDSHDGYEEDYESDVDDSHYNNEDEQFDVDGEVELVGVSDAEPITAAESCDYLILPKNVSRVGSEIDVPSSVHSLFNSIPSVQSMGSHAADVAEASNEEENFKSNNEITEKPDLNENSYEQGNEFASNITGEIEKTEEIQQIFDDINKDISNNTSEQEPKVLGSQENIFDDKYEEQQQELQQERVQQEAEETIKKNGKDGESPTKFGLKSKQFLPSSFWRNKISNAPKPVKYTFRPAHKISSGNLKENFSNNNSDNNKLLSIKGKRKQEKNEDRLSCPPINSNKEISDQYLSSLTGALSLSTGNSPCTNKEKAKFSSAPNTPYNSNNNRQGNGGQFKPNRWLLSNPTVALGVKSTIDNVGTRAMVEATMPTASKLIFHKKWYNSDNEKRPSNESNKTNLSNTNISSSSNNTEYYEDEYTKFIEKKSKSTSPLKCLLPGTLRTSRIDCRSNSTLSVSTSDEEYRPFSARLHDGPFNDDDDE